MIRRVTVVGSVKALRAEALGKPRLNRATVFDRSAVVDAKPGDLPMDRLKRELYRVEDRTHLG